MIQSPNASPNSGVQQPIHAAISTGSMPQNAMINTVNGVSPGGNPAVSARTRPRSRSRLERQSDKRGVAIPGSSGNPANMGTVNNQRFVDGNGPGAADLQTGSTNTNISSATEAPTPSSMLTNNVVLFPQQFQG